MFAGLFGSNTPLYKGQAQPPVQPHGGMFGLITGMFAGNDPLYVRPQPEPAMVPNTAQAPAPTQQAPKPEQAQPDGGTASGGEPDTQGKTITIIVKPGPGTSVEEVVQFLQDRCLDD